MRVHLDLTVEVSADDWRLEYGVEDVREDVRAYVASALAGLPVPLYVVRNA